ncbi:hypothetical protein AB6805_30430 [Chitinophaga sp. RCC_12]|uniref:hypothetical protein n=1 Tax=Chitinophaga sp. RCC_12 TaxID=3239226 RepID=UPI00352326FB
MTCIIGVVSKGKVFIGGDSAGVDGNDMMIRKDEKVFKIGEFIFGCTSSFRMIQLIRYSFTPPKITPKRNIYEYLCTDFINALRECLINGGFAQKDMESEAGGVSLMGYKGRLFYIGDDYQIGEPKDLMAAIGSGAAYSLGAMIAMKGRTGTPPEKMIDISLRVAAHLSTGVRPPFTILHSD